MKRLRAGAFKALTWLFRNLVGRGLGKIPFTVKLYNYLYSHLVTEELTLKVQGSKMITRVSSEDGVSYQLLFYRTGMEKYQTELFKKLVDNGMTVVDIGANIGYYTLMAARLVGKQGRVFAFEPEPKNYDLLVRNVALNKYVNVVTEQKAVSDKTGKADLFISREAGAHGLMSGREGAVGVKSVETISLDSYFKGRPGPLDIVKIDVEGAELAVLKGMTQVVKNNADIRVFTEIYCAGERTKLERPLRQVWDMLVALGFKYIYLIDEQEHKLRPIDYSPLLKRCQEVSAAEQTSPNLLCSKTSVKV